MQRNLKKTQTSLEPQSICTENMKISSDSLKSLIVMNHKCCSHLNRNRKSLFLYEGHLCWKFKCEERADGTCLVNLLIHLNFQLPSQKPSNSHRPKR